MLTKLVVAEMLHHGLGDRIPKDIDERSLPILREAF